MFFSWHLQRIFFLLDFPGVVARREGREGTGVDDGEGEGAYLTFYNVRIY